MHVDSHKFMSMNSDPTKLNLDTSCSIPDTKNSVLILGKKSIIVDSDISDTDPLEITELEELFDGLKYSKEETNDTMKMISRTVAKLNFNNSGNYHHHLDVLLRSKDEHIRRLEDQIQGIRMLQSENKIIKAQNKQMKDKISDFEQQIRR
jgi:hypothetical protein